MFTPVSPAADYSEIVEGDLANHARLRARLAALHTSGMDAGAALNTAIGDGDLTGVRDVASLLLARLPAPAGPADGVRATALPPLPPRHPGTDVELDDYARRIADKYETAIQSSPAAAAADDLDTVLHRYRRTFADLDAQRPARTAALVDATAEADLDSCLTLFADRWRHIDLDDPAWAGAAADLVVGATALDDDPESVLASIAPALGPKPSAREVRNALAERTGPALSLPGAPRSIAAPPHDAAAFDPAVAQQLGDHYRTICGHARGLNELYSTAIADQLPAWAMETLPERPDEPALAVAWADLATDIDLYRRTQNVSDATTALGARPDVVYRDARRAHDLLADRIDRLESTITADRGRLNPNVSAARYRSLQREVVQGWIDHTLDTVLPAAEYATMNAAYPASTAKLRTRLERLHNAGHNVPALQTAAIGDGDTSGIRDTAAYLTAQLPDPGRAETTPADQWASLPPLPSSDAPGVSPAKHAAASTEARRYLNLTDGIEPDAVVRTIHVGDPIRSRSTAALERDAAYLAQPAPPLPEAIAEHAAALARFEDIEATYQKQAPAREAAAAVDAIADRHAAAKQELARATRQLDQLSPLQRRDRRELTGQIGELNATLDQLEHKHEQAIAHARELLPEGRSALVTEADLDLVRAETRRTAATAADARRGHEAAMDRHEQRRADAQAAAAEIERRGTLTPNQAAQEQRIRAGAKKAGKTRRSSVGAVDPALAKYLDQDRRTALGRSAIPRPEATPQRNTSDNDRGL